jgi:hypothetical protein
VNVLWCGGIKVQNAREDIYRDFGVISNLVFVDFFVPD